MGEDKSHRAAASQFFVAGELCRRDLVAVITLGNCPNTDVLVSNKAGTRFAHVQVKTFRPGKDKTVSVGMKAERDYGANFFWVLAGIPEKDSLAEAQYFIIPSPEFSKLVAENHQIWIDTPGKNGQPHSVENTVRAVHIPPDVMKYTRESIEGYRDLWQLIIDACDDPTLSPAKEKELEEILEVGDAG